MYTPNERILQSRLAISRRKALGLGGSVGLAGLIAACTGNTATPTSEKTNPAAINAAAEGTETHIILMSIPFAVTSPRTALGYRWSS